MKKRFPAANGPELHLISPEGISLADWLRLSLAVLPYVDYFHLRDRQLTAKALFEIVTQMHQAGIPLEAIVVNDRLDVALAAGTGGVQLAGHSLRVTSARPLAPGMRIGCSIHSPQEAVSAAGEGADYCLFGHVYESASKPGLPPRGLDILEETAARCPVPVIAIGGIQPDNAGAVIRRGAEGIAILSGISSAADPVAQAEAYHTAIQTAWLEGR
ncbi:thiamine phosphate synthase [Paenibacillus sp. GCM10012306]|uniref:thiamine phosphate synthase n=1 Tax=Paenibacillus sp. GCM10012306 TaxID=3317342 RepID=UPI00360AD002